MTATPISSTPEYRAFLSAKKRCQDEKHISYPRYGGRGIEFRLTSLQELIDHLGLRPSDGYSLDRINNNGHYEIGNIRWATREEQSANRCTNRYITHNGKKLTLAQWARELGGKSQLVVNRLGSGWCDNAR